MSGGRYDYAYYKVDEFARNLDDMGSCDAASTALRRAFRQHLYLVAQAMRACEWNDSGDGDLDEEALIKKVLQIKE